MVTETPHPPGRSRHGAFLNPAGQMQDHASTASRDYHRLAVPPRGSDGLLAEQITRKVAAFLSGAGLFLIAFTLAPFQGTYDPDPTAVKDGNIVNQLGYLGLGGIYLFAILLIVDARVLKRIASPMIGGLASLTVMTLVIVPAAYVGGRVLVLRHATRITLAGLIAGLGLAAMLGRLMATLIHPIAPSDPVTFVAVPIIATLTAAAACLAPAWRATRIDPAIAFRDE